MEIPTLQIDLRVLLQADFAAAVYSILLCHVWHHARAYSDNQANVREKQQDLQGYVQFGVLSHDCSLQEGIS